MPVMQARTDLRKAMTAAADETSTLFDRSAAAFSDYIRAVEQLAASSYAMMAAIRAWESGGGYFAELNAAFTCYNAAVAQLERSSYAMMAAIREHHESIQRVIGLATEAVDLTAPAL